MYFTQNQVYVKDTRKRRGMEQFNVSYLFFSHSGSKKEEKEIPDTQTWGSLNDFFSPPFL